MSPAFVIVSMRYHFCFILNVKPLFIFYKSIDVPNTSFRQSVNMHGANVSFFLDSSDYVTEV